jgi:hypothetical protein
MPPKSAALSPSIKRLQQVGVLGLTSFYNIADGNLQVGLFLAYRIKNHPLFLF